MIQTNLTMSFVQRAEITAIEQLYDERAGNYLPHPDADQIDYAISNNQLIGVSIADGTLVAAGGTFDVARTRQAGESQIVQVYELAGMALKSCVGGLQPYTIQDILLSARIINLAMSEPTNLCLMSSVVRDNKKSMDSLCRMGLSVQTSRPEWLSRIHRAWNRDNNSEIYDLVAAPICIEKCFECLTIAVDGGLWRHNKNTNAREEFILSIFDINSISIALDEGIDVISIDWAQTLPMIRVSKIMPQIDF